MSRPVVWECDHCGTEVRTDNYALPEGWVRVKAHIYPHSEAEGDYCAVCSGCVDTNRLARSGRVIEVAKPRAKAKAKPKDPELPIEAP